LKRLIRMKKVPVIELVIIALIVLVSSPCLAQETFLEFTSQGTMAFTNLTSPPDKSMVFFDLPLGKYRFDTSVQVEPMPQNKVSPIEDDRGFDQNALSLQFSIRW
jgi:hypothetical protein